MELYRENSQNITEKVNSYLKKEKGHTIFPQALWTVTATPTQLPTAAGEDYQTQDPARTHRTHARDRSCEATKAGRTLNVLRGPRRSTGGNWKRFHLPRKHKPQFQTYRDMRKVT